MRCKLGTSRRRAVTFSSTEEYVEVRVDSIMELLRFAGVMLAAVRMGLGGEGADDAGKRADGPGGGGTVPGEEVSAEEDADAEEGFERDVYLSYRSFRIQVA